MDDFNDDKTVKPQDQKFTIGDKEYSQDELNDLVTRGEFARDVETKFNTKLDRVVPDYTRSTQETAELRKKLADMEKAQYEAKAQQGQLSQAELIQRAKQEAQGIGLMTDENTPALIRTEIEKYRLEDAIAGEVEELSGMGINADPQVIKRYMSSMEGDTVNLGDAVKDLYGPQVKLYQENELKNGKPEGLYTDRGSNAGSFRLPENTKVDDSNIGALLAEAIGGGQ